MGINIIAVAVMDARYESGSIYNVKWHVHLIVMPIDVGTDIDLMVQLRDTDIECINSFELACLKPLVKPFEESLHLYFSKCIVATHQESEE